MNSGISVEEACKSVPSALTKEQQEYCGTSSEGATAPLPITYIAPATGILLIILSIVVLKVMRK